MKRQFKIWISCLMFLLLCSCGTKDGEVQLFEKKFVSDWREGNENYYGYGAIENWNDCARVSYYVIQDQTLYYKNFDGKLQPKIYKKSLDKDSVEILNTNCEDGFGVVSLVGVVKDYIYYVIGGNNTYSIYRIRTDGKHNEFLATDYNSGKAYVVGNQLFYTAAEQNGVGSFIYSVVCMNMDTKEVRTIIPNVENGFLQAGYKDFLICNAKETYDKFGGWGSDTFDAVVIYRLDGSLYQRLGVGSLGSLIDPQNDAFHFSKELYILGEDPDVIITLDGEESAYDASKDWSYTSHSDKYKYDVEYGNYEGSGLYIVYRDNSERKLNDDTPILYYDIGDGYVYYTLYESHENHFCRIKQDGTGWEEVPWMFP